MDAGNLLAAMLRQRAAISRGDQEASRRAYSEFLANYERLCRHILATADDWADLVIDLSPGHRPAGVRNP